MKCKTEPATLITTTDKNNLFRNDPTIRSRHFVIKSGENLAPRQLPVEK